MKLRVFQKGFNYSQDGHGNRLILHLQGCNMHCPWCSNPEGMTPEGVIMTEQEWLRDTSCPKGAVQNGVLDRKQCRECERPCLQKKRQKAIRLSCTEYDVEELARECISAVPMFFDGGGVTLTGGEISMQFEPVKELLRMLGEAGIHRAIESNGSHPRMTELIPLVDEWIMDVKHYDDAVHREWIKVPLQNTIRTLDAVSAVHPDVLIHVPLIPGFNSSHEDAEGFVKLFKAHIHGEGTAVEFLAYHEYGKAKWAQCGMEYRMPAVHLEPGTVEYFEAVMRAGGIRVVRT